MGWPFGEKNARRSANYIDEIAEKVTDLVCTCLKCKRGDTSFSWLRGGSIGEAAKILVVFAEVTDLFKKECGFCFSLLVLLVVCFMVNWYFECLKEYSL